MKTKLLGFQLVAPDGTMSLWRFTDSYAARLIISLRLQNGAVLTFEDQPHYIENWAAPRGIKVNYVSYTFDPDTQFFTKD